MVIVVAVVERIVYYLFEMKFETLSILVLCFQMIPLAKKMFLSTVNIIFGTPNIL